MKHILSYIYPVTKTYASLHNGLLEVTWSKGKKQLNSKNANYSYGALQEVLKFGLKKITFSKVDSVLVLGMGGGSVIETLRHDFNFTKHITTVEIDSVIIDIAKTEFGINENKNLTIHCADANTFVKTSTSQFDLIIVDLYIDLKVPNQFLSIEFWDAVLNIKSSKGQILFNAAVGDNNMQADIDAIVSYLRSKIYKTTVYKNVNTTNTIIIANGI